MGINNHSFEPTIGFYISIFIILFMFVQNILIARLLFRLGRNIQESEVEQQSKEQMRTKLVSQQEKMFMDDEAIIYETRIKGHLADPWSDWFDGLSICNTPDGETISSGYLAD